MLTRQQRVQLLSVARAAIRDRLAGGRAAVPHFADPALDEKRGAFVTLRAAGELRGCIGLIEPLRPLSETVRLMAVEAARDPRFPPLTLPELAGVTIEISVLSPPEKADAPERITIPGDGVIVRRGPRQGVFLPQVADETGWDRETFLSNLCFHKAGLPPDAWRDRRTELYTFRAEVFSEADERR